MCPAGVLANAAFHGKRHFIVASFLKPDDVMAKFCPHLQDHLVHADGMGEGSWFGPIPFPSPVAHSRNVVIIVFSAMLFRQSPSRYFDYQSHEMQTRSLYHLIDIPSDRFAVE